MKQILLITALFLFCLSCSSDDDGGGSVSTSPIVGTWRLISYSYEGEMNSGGIPGTVTAVGTNINDVQVTLHPDGSISNNGNTFIVEFTITVEGIPTTQEVATQPMLEGSTYRVEGNMMYVNNPESPIGEIGTPIIELNANTLHLGGENLPPVVPVPGLSSIDLDIRYERVN